MRVLQVAALEGVDLSLEVGERVRDLRPPPDQLGQLLPGVDIGHALLGGHCGRGVGSLNLVLAEYLSNKSSIIIYTTVRE